MFKNKKKTINKNSSISKKSCIIAIPPFIKNVYNWTEFSTKSKKTNIEYFNLVDNYSVNLKPLDPTSKSFYEYVNLICSKTFKHNVVFIYLDINLIDYLTKHNIKVYPIIPKIDSLNDKYLDYIEEFYGFNNNRVKDYWIKTIIPTFTNYYPTTIDIDFNDIIKSTEVEITNKRILLIDAINECIEKHNKNHFNINNGFIFGTDWDTENLGLFYNKINNCYIPYLSKAFNEELIIEKVPYGINLPLSNSFTFLLKKNNYCKNIFQIFENIENKSCHIKEVADENDMNKIVSRIFYYTIFIGSSTFFYMRVEPNSGPDDLECVNVIFSHTMPDY